MWPFNRVKAETGAGTVSATEVVLDALQREASGLVIDPRSLAVIEAAAGLWSRSIGSATITPMSAALDGVTSAMLAHVGRDLADNGNSLWEISVAGSGVRLLPVASWDLRGSLAPETWVYRLTLPGPRGTVTRNLRSASVLHFRVNTSTSAPWKGRSPLQGSSATAHLAAALEAALRVETKIPAAAIVPLAGDPQQVEVHGKAIKKGGVVATGLGQNLVEQGPSSRYSPQRLKPEPDEVMAALRSGTGDHVLAAYGLSPGLFIGNSDGTAQREAWRRAWASTFHPIGQMMQEELREKLDPAATVAFEALRASDEDGRTRALDRRAKAFKTFVDAGLSRADAMRLAGLDETEDSA